MRRVIGVAAKFVLAHEFSRRIFEHLKPSAIRSIVIVCVIHVTHEFMLQTVRYWASQFNLR